MTRGPSTALHGPRRAARLVGVTAAVALAAFHLEILVARLRDATLAEPAVALQWLASLLLLGVAAELRRRHRPLLRGRTGLVLALAVLLLHLGAPPALAAPDDVAALLAALPVGVVLGGLAAVVALGRATLARAPLRRTGRARHARRRRDRHGSLPSLFVPRPPPRLAPTAA